MKKDSVLIFLIILLGINFSSAFNFETGGFKILEPIESNGAIPVNIQDQTSPPLDLFFIQAIGPPTTLAESAFINDVTINLTDTTNFVDGVYIGIFDPDENRFYFGEQLGAPVNNVITIDTPIDFNYSTGKNVIPLTRDLNVDGSGTVQTFVIAGSGQGSDLEIDITRLMISMQTDSAVSLNLFGNVPPLTNGLILRRVDGDTRNIWNVKTNGEIANLAFDYDPHQATNPAQGQDGANFRYTLAGQEKHGVAVRLGPGDELQLLIQDDLSGLDFFRVIAEGHIVTD